MHVFAYRLSVLLFFGWFLFQSAFFALRLQSDIAPDEGQHHFMAKLWRDGGSFFLKDTPQSYSYGAVSRGPYLYYVMTGAALAVKPESADSRIYLRVCTLFLGMLSLFFGFLCVRELTRDRWIHLAALALMTNVLMYPFISGTVSYDNIANPASAASILGLVRFLKTQRRADLLLFLISGLMGSLGKVTVPPLFLLEMGVLLVHPRGLIRSGKSLYSSSLFRKPSVAEGVALAATAVLIGLNANLYVRNVISYGQVVPVCARVLSPEACNSSFQEKVDQELIDMFKEKPRMALHIYLTPYLRSAHDTAFGIFGHKRVMKETTEERMPALIIVALAGFGMFVGVRRFFSAPYLKLYLFLAAAYSAIVMLENYRSYLRLGMFGAGLQGRYWFPVIAPWAAVVAYGLLHWIKSPRIKTAAVGILTAVLAWNGFFWFMSKVDPAAWFRF